MKEKLNRPKMGSERILENNQFTCVIGTVNQKICKSFYINLGGWIYSDYDAEDQIELVHEMSKSIKHHARAMASDLHSDYLYSFIDIQLNETILNAKCSSGYFCIEVTVMTDKSIEFKSQSLTDNATGFCALLTDIILKHPFQFTKNRIKVDSSSKSQI